MDIPQKIPASLKYFGLLLLPFVIFLLGLTVGYNQARDDHEKKVDYRSPIVTTVNGNNNQSPETVNMSLFWDVWNILHVLYVNTEKLDAQKMVYGAIEGMVDALDDPYTVFLNPSQSEDFRKTLSGELEGIGAELTIKDNNLSIVSPVKNSPAEKAGLHPGDIIYSIDNVSAVNMSLTDAVSKIRGKKGSKVALLIIREGEEDPISFEITRDEVKIPSVTWEMKDTIAYLSINQFGDDTNKEFEDAAQKILLRKPSGMILDLRFNGGGYLEGAIDIVSQFIEEGVVTSIETRNQEEKDIKNVKGRARLANIPLVVLINEGSASASEIVAGALKDHKRATIIGEKSFGKGTVQELQPLSDGSNLRLTIAKWFTPLHESIDQKGIMPDMEIKYTKEDRDKGIDPQLEKALEFLRTLK